MIIALNFTSTYLWAQSAEGLLGGFSVITNLRLDLRFKLYSPRPRLQTPTSFLADSQPRKNRNIMDRSCDCGMEIMAQLARNKQQLEWKTNCNLHNSSINAVLVLMLSE